MTPLSLTLLRERQCVLKSVNSLLSNPTKRHFLTSLFSRSNEKHALPSYHKTPKMEIEAGPPPAFHRSDLSTLSSIANTPSNFSSISSSFQDFAEAVEKNIKPTSQAVESVSTNPSWDQIDPRTVQRVYYFDSLEYTKKLESKGFTREQAEGCVECLLEVIGNTLEHQAKNMITKSEQKIAELQLHAGITSVKKDMVLLQKSEFSALRTETEKISNSIGRIQTRFEDEMVKLKGQVTLDINLERGRAVEAHAANEKSLQMLDNKIETEIAHLKTTYEVYRNDIFKYAGGTVLTCTTLILGFIRLWT